jgi:hypothetical protein
MGFDLRRAASPASQTAQEKMTHLITEVIAVCRRRQTFLPSRCRSATPLRSKIIEHCALIPILG